MASSAWGFNTAGLASATSPGLVQAGGYNVLPAGTVLPYAGGTAPTGFLICDGSEISKTTYPQLYAAIADVYATQINPTTGLAWAAPSASNFRIPDYRGSFLRSVGTPSVGDAVTLGGHQVQKTAKNGLANASSSISGTTASHNHYLFFNGSSPNPGVAPTNTTYVYTTQNFGGALDYNLRGVASSPNVGLSSLETPAVSGTATAQTITGDNETRPLNKGVNYIIKY